MTNNRERQLRVGLAGLGTVGQGLVDLINENPERIALQAGRPIQIVRVANRSIKPHVSLGNASFSTELDSLVADDVDVVVELIGGTDAALRLILSCIRAHKPIVTGNKALLAEKGNELIQVARMHHGHIGFEASVASGIPIIASIKNGLAGNRIDWIAAIINGTCNYILTAMDEAGTHFEEALQNAQKLGYAEADPTFDIEGIDAAQKLAILSAIAFETSITMDGMFTEGISGIEVEDLAYARELGFRVKHLGISKCEGGFVESRVHPALVAESDLLSHVSSVDNAVAVGGSAVGSVLFVGPGAGARAAASAVLADLIEIARNSAVLPKFSDRSVKRTDIVDISCSYYLNVPAKDKPGVIATIGEELGKFGVSIESVIQKREHVREINGTPWVPVVILTNIVKESVIRDVLSELEAHDEVCGKVRLIRVFESTQ